MRYEQALDIICGAGYLPNSCEEVCVKALEKQVPKKPINKTKQEDLIDIYYENCQIIVCPTCNKRLKLKSKGKYCDKCGQAIDWSEEE